jgi:DNA-binding CsgD family transcriptional regulator
MSNNRMLAVSEPYHAVNGNGRAVRAASPSGLRALSPVAAVAAPAQDSVAEGFLEQTLQMAQNLISSAICAYRDEPRSGTADRDTVREVIRSLLARPENTLRCVVATEWLAMEIIEVAGELSDRGRIEMLCDRSVVDAFVDAKLRRLDRCEARVAPKSMPEMILVQGAAAMCRSRADDGELPFFDCPELQEVLYSFYRNAWRLAPALGAFQDFTLMYSCDQTRQILNMLSKGYKDEVAARQVGVSVRTYRRYVADLAHTLGVQSRFQIAVRAVELGLMDRGGDASDGQDGPSARLN